jgi:hypothetical protein
MHVRQDPLPGIARGELANIREDQLAKCERAMLTGSFVESCQDNLRVRAHRRARRSAMMKVARMFGKKRAREMGSKHMQWRTQGAQMWVGRKLRLVPCTS